MPRLIGGPEKAHDADVTIAAHAMHVRTTMPILVLFVEFPTFSNHKITHNASYFSKMTKEELLARLNDIE